MRRSGVPKWAAGLPFSAASGSKSGSFTTMWGGLQFLARVHAPRPGGWPARGQSKRGVSAVQRRGGAR